MDMTFAPIARRWVILVSGSLLLVLGVIVLCTNLPIAFGWAEYAPISGMAFYPGLSSAHGIVDGIGRVSFDRYASFSGQIAIALGIALVTGWIGFALGKRA
jgi:hypothetical protein